MYYDTSSACNVRFVTIYSIENPKHNNRHGLHVRMRFSADYCQRKTPVAGTAAQRTQIYILWRAHKWRERDFKSVTNSKTLPFIYHYLSVVCECVCSRTRICVTRFVFYQVYRIYKQWFWLDYGAVYSVFLKHTHTLNSNHSREISKHVHCCVYTFEKEQSELRWGNRVIELITKSKRKQSICTLTLIALTRQ